MLQDCFLRSIFAPLRPDFTLEWAAAYAQTDAAGGAEQRGDWRDCTLIPSLQTQTAESLKAYLKVKPKEVSSCLLLLLLPMKTTEEFSSKDVGLQRDNYEAEN